MTKGNAEGRKMVLEMAGTGDKVDVLIPQPMNMFMSLSGYWLSTYNLETSQEGEIPDPKTEGKKNARTLPGHVKARKEFLRAILYRKTQEKPRLFRVFKNDAGQYVLFKDKPYKSA